MLESSFILKLITARGYYEPAQSYSAVLYGTDQQLISKRDSCLSLTSRDSGSETCYALPSFKEAPIME